jgi:hypothetical protein
VPAAISLAHFATTAVVVVVTAAGVSRSHVELLGAHTIMINSQQVLYQRVALLICCVKQSFLLPVVQARYDADTYSSASSIGHCCSFSIGRVNCCILTTTAATIAATMAVTQLKRALVSAICLTIESAATQRAAVVVVQLAAHADHSCHCCCCYQVAMRLVTQLKRAHVTLCSTPHVRKCCCKTGSCCSSAVATRACSHHTVSAL